ncbi:MAG: hypothetical protein KGK11_09095 [Sphingomonadales bacterium]|nr:hypothetical protein [Sphingomonadales bacterium]
MPLPRARFVAAMILGLALLAGCSSADSRAAAYASQAQAALDEGRFPEALVAARKALAERDDVVEYWLLVAHIDLKSGDRSGAFNAYQYVYQLDQTNTEALQALCQLSLVGNQPDLVDKYADQLLLITPSAPMPLLAKGNAALIRGDVAGAAAFAERVLAQDPLSMGGLVLKARVAIANRNFADAAALVAKAQETPDDRVSKLELQRDLYAKLDDHAHYEQSLRDLAAANPNDAPTRFAYADMLYQTGASDEARRITRATMAANPHSFAVAAEALRLWLETGPAALDLSRLPQDAAGLSPLMKADYAQYANEMGRPDLALTVLSGLDRGSDDPETTNARVAYAYALGLTGRRKEAMDRLDRILDSSDGDPDQPWALLARARLFALAHDDQDAIRDARLAVANDPQSAAARLALADILRAAGNPQLGASALREGLRALPTDTRLAARLAALLAAQGEPGQAAEIGREIFRAAPMDMRARQLRDQYAGAAAEPPRG